MLEEIGVENADYFHAAGGEEVAGLPCLNDGDDGTGVLEEAIARRELAGWV
jgi:protoporphyrin/coproporphyrin ferrochelatase